MKHSNPIIAVATANLKLILKKSHLRIAYDKVSNLYSITDGNKTIFFGNLVRGHRLYQKGIDNRAKEIFYSYLLDKITFIKNDIIIDCGANYGDLWLCLKEKINDECYITFEPGTLEHKSIKLNAPGGKHNQLGLSDKAGKERYYINEEDADSSLLKTSNFTHYFDIETTTLVHYLNSNNIDRIKLLKLEAEGFEPEILEGSREVLHKIDYIAVDGGYERGEESQETFSNISNLLLQSNFEMVSINFKWSRALFSRKT